MRKIWLIVKREYLTRVRTKAFLFTTIAVPALLVGYMVLVVGIARRPASKTLRIAVVDEVGDLAQPISTGLTDKLSNGRPAYEVVESLEKPQGDENIFADLRAKILKGQLDGYLVVPPGVLEGKEAEFHTRNPGDVTRTGSLWRAMTDAVVSRRLSDRGVHVDDPSKLMKGVGVKVVKVTTEGESEERGETVLVGLMVGMILYMTLVIYGVSTMRSVLEEKTTHIVEILVSSLRPIQLLEGKILGVAAVALTQYLVWTVTGGLLAGYGAAMASTFSTGTTSFNIRIPAPLLVYTVVFFLGGYFLYASLYATVGAIVSSEQEAQQMQLPVTLPLILTMLLLTVVVRDSNSTASVVLSMVPFFAPVLMLVRIALQTPPLWQILLSLALMVVTTLGVVWFSARIYRVGILMYGKRPSLVEIFRWLRYT